jgi:hypothetical protein
MPKPPTTAHSTAQDTSAAVDAFLADLKPPHKDVAQALRALILSADPSIREGIKWNAPSYRIDEYFATTHLRGKRGLGLILHFGAKARGGKAPPEIADPAGLLEWLAADRARAQFDDLADFEAKSKALKKVVQAWIRHV